ncbi:MAG TPA: rhomboid family intramembrane serine protease [Gemmatimonadaceae bacterium]|nr:rhomboid family intramembrane serine protease [Gemmatimonadaceae bacterium]
MTPVVRTLLIANILVFFLQETLPAFANAMVFVPRLVLVRPWSIVTYMFLHGGLMHILFNMLGLFFFGSRVEERLGSRRFTILYFLSGISGAILSFFFSPYAPIIGASAGVFGVMMAFAYYWPNEPILIWGVLPVPARVLVIITTLLALWSGLGGVRSGVAHFAHLGGYAGAYLYLRWLERARTAFKRKATAPTPESTRRVEGWKQIDMGTVHEVNRAEVNRILDKISAHGIGSLTPQERTFLSNFVPPDDRM